MSNYKNLLNELKKVNEGSAFDVYVPSVDKMVKFTHLNVKQQKEIIKSAMDNSINSVLFINTVNKIIKDNCMDKSIKFTMIDRAPIIIALRANSFNKNYEVDVDGEEKVYNLLDHVKKYNEFKFKQESSKIFSIENIKIYTRIPTLLDDTEINAKCLNSIKGKTNLNDEESVSRALSEVFVYEILKYIDYIEFVGDTDPVKVDFSETNVADRYQLVEAFPMSVNNMIIEFISGVREYEENFTKLEESDDRVTINIDPTFFSDS